MALGVGFPSPKWATIVVLLSVFSMINRIEIDVSAFIINPDYSGFRRHGFPFQFMLSRRTTSLSFHKKGGGNERNRNPQREDQQRQQSEFFFNTSALQYMNDDGVDIVVTNDPMKPPLSSLPTVETAGSATGNFGDIMSPTVEDADLLFQDGLVTSESYSLEEIYGISNPLDRMAVTANGNLQRLFSSYYDAPVVVEMVHCTRQMQPCSGSNEGNAISASAIWNRRVMLKIFNNHTFCTADSVIEVHSREVEDLVESGKVGIGQIFRHFNILPEFTLLAAGPMPDGGFWRNYTLESNIVTCSIREVFCESVWELS